MAKEVQTKWSHAAKKGVKREKKPIIKQEKGYTIAFQSFCILESKKFAYLHSGLTDGLNSSK